MFLAAALAQLPGGTVFRRLSQEVEAAAAERHGGIKVYQLQVSIVHKICCHPHTYCSFCTTAPKCTSAVDMLPLSDLQPHMLPLPDLLSTFSCHAPHVMVLAGTTPACAGTEHISCCLCRHGAPTAVIMHPLAPTPLCMHLHMRMQVWFKQIPWQCCSLQCVCSAAPVCPHISLSPGVPSCAIGGSSASRISAKPTRHRLGSPAGARQAAICS